MFFLNSLNNYFLLLHSNSRSALTTKFLYVIFFLDSSAQILSDVEYIYKGSSVSAECLVTGDKFDGWYTPKGDRVGNKGRIRIETFGEGDFHLVIDQVTVDDEGNYTCRCAQNNATYQLHILGK